MINKTLHIEAYVASYGRTCIIEYKYHIAENYNNDLFDRAICKKDEKKYYIGKLKTIAVF